jgi:hypothetical protein
MVSAPLTKSVLGCGQLNSFGLAMTIHCPHCAAAYAFPVAEGEGCMVECPRCGTRWLARLHADDPYRRAFPAPALPGEVADAIVIEHVAPGFAPTPPRPRPERRSPVAGLGWQKAAGAFLGGAVAIMLLGAPIVAALPDSSVAAGLPSGANQLAFQRVRSETVQRRGVRTLVVEGQIVNRSRSDIALPAVRVSLHAPDGAEVYSWLVEPTTTGVAAGRSVGFRSTVAAPSAEAAQVTLKLAAREGQVVGAR